MNDDVIEPGGVAVVDEPTDEQRIALLEQQLAEATARAESAEAERDAFNPTHNIEGYLMTSIEDVEMRFEGQHLKDIAERELAEINRVRLKNGYLPINYSDDEWAAALEKVKQELLTDRERQAPPAEGALNRTLKMWNPAGALVQIPYEAQINNQAGSLEDGIARYRNKGFKLPKPMLCPTQDCYNRSAVNDAGEYRFKAYCTQDHHDRTERVSGSPVENVVTANAGRPLQTRR